MGLRPRYWLQPSYPLDHWFVYKRLVPPESQGFMMGLLLPRVSHASARHFRRTGDAVLRQPLPSIQMKIGRVKLSKCGFCRLLTKLGPLRDAFKRGLGQSRKGVGALEPEAMDRFKRRVKSAQSTNFTPTKYKPFRPNGTGRFQRTSARVGVPATAAGMGNSTRNTWSIAGSQSVTKHMPPLPTLMVRPVLGRPPMLPASLMAARGS